MMRTNVVLNESLVQDALKDVKNVQTKRELIHLALEGFVQNHKRLDLCDLPGKIKLEKDYDYKVLRKEE